MGAWRQLISDQLIPKAKVASDLPCRVITESDIQGNSSDSAGNF